MILITKYWKYILIFFIGLLLPLMVPFSPISRLLNNNSKYVKAKEDQINKLELENAKLQGVNERIVKEKNITDEHIKSLQHKHDSLSGLISDQNDYVDSFGNTTFTEINKIENYSNKEIYNFYKTLK
jgi:hypothetical protein